MDGYLPFPLISKIEGLTDQECLLPSTLWQREPDWDLVIRILRDEELTLDLTGNLDSCA